MLWTIPTHLTKTDSSTLGPLAQVWLFIRHDHTFDACASYPHTLQNLSLWHLAVRLFMFMDFGTTSSKSGGNSPNHKQYFFTDCITVSILHTPGAACVHTVWYPICRPNQYDRRQRGSRQNLLHQDCRHNLSLICRTCFHGYRITVRTTTVILAVGYNYHTGYTLLCTLPVAWTVHFVGQYATVMRFDAALGRTFLPLWDGAGTALLISAIGPSSLEVLVVGGRGSLTEMINDRRPHSQ